MKQQIILTCHFYGLVFLKIKNPPTKKKLAIVYEFFGAFHRILCVRHFTSMINSIKWLIIRWSNIYIHTKILDAEMRHIFFYLTLNLNLRTLFAHTHKVYVFCVVVKSFVTNSEPIANILFLYNELTYNTRRKMK